MRSNFISAISLASLATLTSATSILLPLYVYPSVTFNDNASNWQPLLSTVRANRDVFFHVVINPDSGPGCPAAGRNDINYAAGVTLLNAEPNVRTMGYVHTTWGNESTNAVINNVTEWAKWPAPSNVQGIFFDETPNGNPWHCWDETVYMNDLVDRTRFSGFSSGTIVFNVGQKVVDGNVASYFNTADIVIVFEETWALYQIVDPVANNVPAGMAGKSSIIVHNFDSDVGRLETELNRIRTLGLNSTWWTTTDYGNYTQPPANAENLARILP